MQTVRSRQEHEAADLSPIAVQKAPMQASAFGATAEHDGKA
jgi:hypothetical protein